MPDTESLAAGVVADSLETGSPVHAVLHGPQAALDPQPLHRYLETAARDWPERPWISENDRSISFAQGLNAVASIAAGLSAIGLVRGDRVGLFMPNHPAYILLAFACWRQGLAVVGLNPVYSDNALRQQINDSQPRLLVTLDVNGLPDRLAAMVPQGCRKILITQDSALGDIVPKTRDGWIRSTEFCGPNVSPVASLDDLAVLQYTGGTTGEPKGAMLSYANIASCAEQILFGMRDFQRGKESFLALGPFTHVIGTTLILTLATAVAGEIAMCGRFDPEVTTQFALDRRISVIFAVPTIFGAIAASAAARDGDWTCLTYALCGGAPLPSVCRAEFERVTNVRLHQGYGCSETGSGAVFTGSGDTYPEGSVGAPLANCTITIRSPEGSLLADDEIGEICVAGPNVMQGYWICAEATEAAMDGAAFRTGDSGYISNGALFVVDRLKDMIIASGFNVYPRIVEEAIQLHPAVREVAVVGVLDAYRGETVRAIISLNPGMTLTIEDLQVFTRETLSAIEIPRQLVILDALPRTPIGKIAKTELRS